MDVLKTKKRELGLSSKQLKQKDLVPAILYGKHLDESIPLEINVKDLDLFMKTNIIGSRFDLMVGRKKYPALLKNFTQRHLSTDIEHLDFQALVLTEVVNSSAQIVLLNGEEIREGILQQSLEELAFRALPDDLFERIELDVSQMEPGDVITVADLPEAANESIEVLTALDAVVVSLVVATEFVEEELEAEEGEEAADVAEGETEETAEAEEDASEE